MLVSFRPGGADDRGTPADPGPAGAQLVQLRPVLVWWMCERAKRKLGWDTMGIDADATMKTADYGVFIDVMSLYQPDLDTDTSPTSGGAPPHSSPHPAASSSFLSP